MKAKDKIRANNEEATSPEFVENTLTEEGTESTALQNPDTSTRNSYLQAEKCKVVRTEDRDSNSLSCNSTNNSCHFESKQGQGKDANKQSTEHTDALTSHENSSTCLNHEGCSFNERTRLEELRFPNTDAATTSIPKEQDSDSEDELEQFVFQPKGSRGGNRNLPFT